MPQPIDPFTELARMHAAERIQQIADRASLAAQTRLTSEAALAATNQETQVQQSRAKGEQVDEALRTAADYVAVGPVFGTATKDTGYSARGLELVGRAAGRGKPVVAIGGITLARAPEVIGAGAGSVAVITDLLSGGDPESRVREYIRALQ